MLKIFVNAYMIHFIEANYLNIDIQLQLIIYYNFFFNFH